MCVWENQTLLHLFNVSNWESQNWWRRCEYTFLAAIPSKEFTLNMSNDKELDAMVTHQADNAALCVLTAKGALKSWYLVMLLENRGSVFIYSALKLINKGKCKVLTPSWPASTASNWKMCVNLHHTHPASDQTDLRCVQTSLWSNFYRHAIELIFPWLYRLGFWKKSSTICSWGEGRKTGEDVSGWSGL